MGSIIYKGVKITKNSKGAPVDRLSGVAKTFSFNWKGTREYYTTLAAAKKRIDGYVE